MDASNKAVVSPLPADQAALAVEVFRMLADGTRIQILWALIDGEMPIQTAVMTARRARTHREGPARWIGSASVCSNPGEGVIGGRLGPAPQLAASK